MRMAEAQKKLNVVVCGEGNAVHVMIAQIGASSEAELRVLGMMRGEELKAELQKSDYTVTCHNPDGSKISGRVDKISLDPAELLPDADLVLLPLPVFAHRPYFEAIRDHIQPGTAIGVLPGQGGSQWLAKQIFGDKFESLIYFGSDKLPYNTRIEQFGKSVRLYGLKKKLGVATLPASKAQRVADMITRAFGGIIEGTPLGHMFSVTLMPVNQCIHPSRMYSLFHDWDGETPYERNPLFYEEMSERATEVMGGVDDEIQAVAEALRSKCGMRGVDVPRIHPMLVSWYEPELIGDASTLLSYFRTNKGYAGIDTPMKKVGDEQWVPDFGSRYFTEDIPFGLAITRGIAELVGVRTPTIDMLIEWAQDKMGKQFLVDGKLAGPDVQHTFAPQAFNVTDPVHLD